MSINKDSQKAPNIRFKGFTDDWEQRDLENLVTRVKSYSLSRSVETNSDTNTKYIHYGDIHTHVADKIEKGTKLPNIIPGDYETLNKGDLVLADASEDYQGIATPAIVMTQTDYSLVAGLHTIALRPIKIDSLYLYYLIKSSTFRKYGYKVGTGMKVFGISVNRLLEFKAFMPITEEQSKIAELLLLMDKSITLHQRKLDQLNQLKEALLHQMFPGKGETVPKLRFAGFEGDWEERKLGEISKIKTGSSDLQDADATGNYPFFVRSENIERSNRFLFEGEAILIPGEGRLGEIYHYINGKFDYHQRVYKISNFSDYNVQGLFVLYYLKNNFKRHALKYTVKATVDSLRLPTLLEFNIMVPNNEEQQHISNLLNGLEKLVQANENRINDLKSLKTVLLQNMFI